MTSTITVTAYFTVPTGEDPPLFAIDGATLGSYEKRVDNVDGLDQWRQSFVVPPGSEGGGGGGGGAVDSVNGKIGIVTLSATDIAEAGGRLWLTSSERTKLSGIQEGAQVNPTASAIVAAIDSNLGQTDWKSGGVTDHGALGGKDDDDHTQYHTDARGDARYYTQTQLTSGGVLDGRYYTETEVDAALAGKAASSHTHSIANVTGLQTALDGKAATSHTQTASTITDFNARVDDRIQLAGIVASTGLESFRVAATANVNIASGPSSIDNVALASGDRVFLPFQTDKTQRLGYQWNGVGQPMTLVSDMDADSDIRESMEVRIGPEGQLYGSTRWTLITPKPGGGYVVGTTQLEWTDRLNDLASDLDTFRLSGSFATSPVVEVLKDFRVVDNGYAGFAADPSDETRGILDIPHPMDADVVASGYEHIADGAKKLGDLIAELDGAITTGGGGGGGGPTPGGDLLLVAVTLGVAVPANTPITLFPEHFPSDHPLWDKIQDDGGDLEAYDDEAKATRLPLHRVKFNYASKILALTTTCPTDKSSGSKLYIQFGNDGTPKTLPASTAAYGSRAVYAGLKAAFVLTGTNPVNFVNDQTASLAGSPVQGSGPNGLPAIGLGATDGGGSSDRIVTPYTDNPSAISCFAVVDGYGPVFSKNKGASGTATNDMFYMNPNNSGRLEYRKQFSSGQKDWYQGGSTSPAPGTFKRVGLRHSGVYTENPNFWVNGTKLTATQGAASGGTQLTTAHPYVLGNRHDFSAALDGFMSVVYIADVALSDAWFAAVDANHANPSAFATVDEGVASGGAFATESYVGAQFARIKSAAGITIEDDAAASIAPGHIGGEMKVQVYDPVTDKLLFNFSGTVQYNLDSSPSIAALNDGADFETDTGALTGTTGADAKFTVSAAEGAIYFENRTGATVRVVRTLFGDG